MAADCEIAVVLGSPTPPGRFHTALRWLLEMASTEFPDRRIRLVDLRELGPYLVDGTPLSGYSDAVQQAVESVTGAKAVILASPIFRASYTGLLKDFLDLLPVDALMGKPVGIAGMGATRDHYLALENQLRPVLAWFGALVTPVAAYLRSDHFSEGQLGAEGQNELGSLLRCLVGLIDGLPAGALGPSPLAARYLQPAPSKG